MKKSIIKGIISGVALSAAIVTLVSCGSKEDKEYVVSFNSNDPVTTDSIRPTVYNDIVVKSGKTVDLTQYQPTYDGWTFDGWYTDAEFTDEFTSESKVKADVKLYAKWIDTLDITFNSNGGTNVDPQSILPGSTVTRPANPSKASVTNDNHTVSSYTFAGWFTNEALTNAFDFATEVTTDLTLYAKYDVSVEAAEGYSLVTSTINFADYEVAGTSALTAFTTADGVFSISADGNKNQIRGKNRTWTKDTYTPSVTAGSVTLYAKCNINSYQVTINAGNGVGTLTASGWTSNGSTSISKTVTYNEIIDLSQVVTVTNKTGYTGTSWVKTSGEGTLDSTIYTVGTGAATLTVNATGLVIPTCLVQANSTARVYNYATIVVTAKDVSADYDTGVTAEYKFGYAANTTNALGNFDTNWGESNTKTLAKNAYRGTRYYGVMVQVTGDGGLSSTCTSTTGGSTETNTDAARVRAIIRNAYVNFDATTNGGILTGTTPIFVEYGGTSYYTTTTGTAAPTGCS